MSQRLHSILFLDVGSSYKFFQALGAFQECERRQAVLRNGNFPSHSKSVPLKASIKSETTILHVHFQNSLLIECMQAGASLSHQNKHFVQSFHVPNYLSCYVWTFLYKQSSREKFYCCFSLVGHMVKHGADQRLRFLWWQQGKNHFISWCIIA